MAYQNKNQNVLLGKKITGLKISSDRQALMFQTPEGEIVVDTDADCCSYTWVEHIEMPALGLPAIVMAVENLDMPDGKESSFHTDSDSLAFYGCKITTDRGELVIDYRNDSNGYYGGSLSWPGEYHYGGVHGQNNSNHEWQDIV